MRSFICINKYLCATALLLIAFTASAEIKSPEFIDGTKLVSAEEAIELITSKDDLVVIDARKASDRDEAGWIEGSIALPNYDTTPETLAKNISGKTTPVLFYCNGVKCGRSVDSSKMAVKEGYKEIYWFRGGWAEWTEKGLPATH